MNDNYRDDALMAALRLIDPAEALPPPSADDPDAVRLLHRIVALKREPRHWGASLFNARRQRPTPNIVRSRRSIPKLVAAATLIAAIGGVLALRSAPAPASVAPKDGAGFVVTTASVQEMAAATREALAHSGAAEATFANTIAGLDGAYPQVWSGSSAIAFSGSDIGVASQFTMAPGDRSGRPIAQSATFRIIAGREYGLYKGAWYLLPHRATPSISMLQPDSDPRMFLQILSPSAMFQFVGRENIGGVELSHLRASNRDLSFPIQQDGTVDQPEQNGKDLIEHIDMTWSVRVNALDVWVDAGGIVHRMNVTMSTSTNAISYSPRALVGVANFPAEAMTDVVSLTFSQLGERETIPTPAHASTSAPPGCGGSDGCIVPQYGVLPAVPLLLKP